MSIVGTLRNGFRPVAQAGAAVALAVSPMMAPASYADDAQITSVAASYYSLSPAAQESVESVAVLADADHEANKHVADQPGRMAISVAIGRDTKVPVSRVEQILREDFKQYGVTDIEFYYEMGGAGDTTVAYHTDDKVWGPYALARARDFVKSSAEQFQFNTQLALLR